MPNLWLDCFSPFERNDVTFQVHPDDGKIVIHNKFENGFEAIIKQRNKISYDKLFGFGADEDHDLCVRVCVR